jgi:hypothetical protein
MWLRAVILSAHDEWDEGGSGGEDEDEDEDEETNEGDAVVLLPERLATAKSCLLKIMLFSL